MGEVVVERWLTAPVQHQDGHQERRSQGTPQGGVISPLLSNLFLHYALDAWMVRSYPQISFARYADDAIYHCRSQHEAGRLLLALKQRLKECGLQAHPEKTRRVYCKDSNRREDYPEISFDFLGYRFKPRKARNRRGQIFTSFSPSMSPKALKRVKDRIRQWGVIGWSERTPEEIAQALNPAVRGWLNYYGHFGRADGVYRLRNYLNEVLVRWARKKYKRLKRSYRKSRAFMTQLYKQNRYLFTHWVMRMC